jgi:hypothetical protein
MKVAYVQNERRSRNQRDEERRGSNKKGRRRGYIHVDSLCDGFPKQQKTQAGFVYKSHRKTAGVVRDPKSDSVDLDPWHVGERVGGLSFFPVRKHVDIIPLLCPCFDEGAETHGPGVDFWGEVSRNRSDFHERRIDGSS